MERGLWAFSEICQTSSRSITNGWIHNPSDVRPSDGPIDVADDDPLGVVDDVYAGPDDDLVAEEPGDNTVLQLVLSVLQRHVNLYRNRPVSKSACGV